MKTFLVFLFFTFSSCHSQLLEDNVVLINVGEYDKGKIAKLIAKVSALNPKVISIDIAFSDYDGNNDDVHLSNTLRNSNSLVMATTIESVDEERVYFALASRGEFSPVHKKTGFVSARIEGDKVSIPKQFIVQLADFNGDIEYNFSIQTAMSFDSLTTMRFIKDNPQTVSIDYKNGDRKFKTFSASEVLNGNLNKNDIEGKIVMLGFLGPGNSDKFYTTLSSKPEMYGLEYLANIVAQVLEYK